MCDVDVVEVGPRPTPEDLAAIRDTWGGEVLVFTDSRQIVPWSTRSPEVWSSARMARWPHSLYPSFSPIRFSSDLWLGTIDQDGSVTPVAPAE
jgi:hypothetical protein